MIKQISSNVHTYKHTLNSLDDSSKILLISDPHWDNPKCNREKLKRDLDEAVKGNHRILINGDLFCLMQGLYDPRKSKSDIRPEHNVSNYFDAIIEDAVEWFKPYAEHIDVIGYGNHETSILRRQETDILKRFVTILNHEAKPDQKVHVGGYGGWYVYQTNYHGSKTSFKVKYFHGSGGGAPVTKGNIQHNRAATSIHGADMIWMGHVHNDYETTYAVEYLDNQMQSKQKNILMVRTSTYKEEYGTGRMGWHVERGAPPKPIGGRWLELNYFRDHEKRNFYHEARTYRT